MNMSFVGLFLSTIVTIILFIYFLRMKPKKQLTYSFLSITVCLFIWNSGLIAQILFSESYNINPIYFDYVSYIGLCFLPITILATGIIFANTKIKFKKIYSVLFIVPIISLIILWTNDFHHLFYEVYSINMNEWVYGKYFMVHSIYSYTLLFIGLVYLIRYSIKNAGFFSKQSILIVLGCLCPIIVNVLGTLKIFAMTLYTTPITFTISIACFALAIFQFDLLSVTPIALQRIVDRMSDSYIVLDEQNVITDFNKSFLTTFKVKEQNMRNKNIFDWEMISFFPKLKHSLQSVSMNSKTASFEVYIDKIDKHFNVEVSSLINKDVFLGTLILFKDITQHIKDMQTIQDNQDMLVERERFASLGQMIGGIAHNLKTPIMSIAGAVEALNDLITEYDSSVGDPDVTNDDHHAIANDMRDWVSKVKTHTSYMSDVITAVKGQATTTESVEKFTMEELISRVSILMKHDLKHSLVELNCNMNVDKDFTLYGNINSLVQVIDNLISNAIQSYKGAPDNEIDLSIEQQDNSLVISVKDYGCGMSKDIKNKLFKEMITTKGKNGTGLGLFMSYSNIKAKFNGTISFESEERKRFYI